MAYPTGLEETRAGTLSAHPGYVCRWRENGCDESNGKATEMSADPHDRSCGKGARQRAGLPDFAALVVVCPELASLRFSY
jgi:hypothetical protein